VNPQSPIKTQRDPRCETGEGPQTDPGPPPANSALQQYEELDRFSSIDASSGAPPYPAMTIPMLYGTKQFGHRKIKIGHGYGPLDAAQTRLALETDPAPTDTRFPSTNQKAFHYAYSVNPVGGATVACMRTVVVEYATDKNGYFRGVHKTPTKARRSIRE
jgi:hypothetical protein